MYADKEVVLQEAIEELTDELEMVKAENDRLREAVKAFSCDCFEGQCAQWGEDGPRFDCVFRRYRGLVEKE